MHGCRSDVVRVQGQDLTAGTGRRVISLKATGHALGGWLTYRRGAAARNGFHRWYRASRHNSKSHRAYVRCMGAVMTWCGAKNSPLVPGVEPFNLANGDSDKSFFMGLSG